MKRKVVLGNIGVVTAGVGRDATTWLVRVRTVRASAWLRDRGSSWGGKKLDMFSASVWMSVSSAFYVAYICQLTLSSCASSNGIIFITNNMDLSFFQPGMCCITVYEYFIRRHLKLRKRQTSLKAYPHPDSESRGEVSTTTPHFFVKFRTTPNHRSQIFLVESTPS